MAWVTASVKGFGRRPRCKPNRPDRPSSETLHNNGSEQFTRNTANALRVTLENSPSKVAAADQPFSHLISVDAVVSAESDAWAAPFTTKFPGAASGTWR
jgi:hypothetical protein